MKYFDYHNAESFEQASELLKAHGNSAYIAGGTDIVDVMKEKLLPNNPDNLIGLKTINDAAYINVEEDCFKIGAMTKLTALEESEALNSRLPILAEAAKSVATPLIRNVGTIGGNICQDVRCWYYRYPHDSGGRMVCARKGGEECFALYGKNQYHSVFGAMKVCTTQCTQKCPAGTDIPAYMEKIREGDWDAAARIVLNSNPMPMFTSRICPHPCEDDCNQRKHGDNVQIHCVERTIGDYILENAGRFYCQLEADTGKKIAVIGAGPGGLSCAYYMRSRGHDVTVYDSHEKPGGVLYYGIPHYRSPRHIVEQFVDALTNMGIKFCMNTTIGEDIKMDKIVADYDSVYIGTGAWKQPILGIHGEELTEFGLDFLVEVNSFLTKVIDDEVLVCGGGNVAMDVALTAKRMGAKNVRLVCLEQEGEMPATSEEVERAKEEGIEIFNGWGLKEVVTDTDGKVTGLKSMRCVSVFDEKGRFSPDYDEADTKIFDAKTVILAIGQKVDLSFLDEKFSDQLKTGRGLFNVDEETYQTKNEKIYAGGDAVTGPNIAIRAIKAGVAAAKAMNHKLGSTTVSKTEANGFLHFDAQGVMKQEGMKQEELAVAERTLVDEDSKSLSKEQALEESKRCINCGCLAVNPSDIAPVLFALDAVIKTNERSIRATDFFGHTPLINKVLHKGEVVTEIEVPACDDYKTSYKKLRLRNAIDFAIISLATAYKVEDGVVKDARIVFGGVAPVPYRMIEAERFVVGKQVCKEMAEETAELVVANTLCLKDNTYKAQQIKAYIKESLLELV